jgi:hypothetical protein
MTSRTDARIPVRPSPTTATTKLLQRKCACGGAATGLLGTCPDCLRKKGLGLQARLEVGPSDDPFEQEADRTADQILGSSTGAVPRRPQSATAARAVRSMPSTGSERTEGIAPASVDRVLRTPGEPLGAATRDFFEQRFGHDFGHVRIHADSQAAESARDVQARAFTVGHDVVFAGGAYAPHGQDGKHLLAHELTHVVQQTPSLRRKPAKRSKPAPPPEPDPLCDTFDFQTARGDVESQVARAIASGDVLPLIRSLKPIRRCASPEQQSQVRGALASTSLTPAQADEVWAASSTALGGHVGFYPGYAPDIKTHLGKLGATESLSSGNFELSAKGSTHRSRAKTTAASHAADLERSDIVYFRGHQYAQYKAPGHFANGNETQGVDLRYFEKAGGFSNVKLMISTSCATLCQEAAAVFSGLFPNAVILGYRKSAPIEGAKVRSDLTQRINALTRPLLLDQPVDIAAIISIWRSIVESRHKGQTGPQAGYLQGGTVTYWDGSAWQTITATDAKNACKIKGNFRGQYPEPV